MPPRRGSILLVDDEEKILKVLGRALRETGCAAVMVGPEGIFIGTRLSLEATLILVPPMSMTRIFMLTWMVAIIAAAILSANLISLWSRG